MPLYEYKCEKCGRFERIVKFSDPPLAACPTCGGVVQKLFSSPAIQFKGSGFYITDYPKKSSSDSSGAKASSDKSSSDKADKSSSDKGSGEKSSSEKSDKSSEKSDKSSSDSSSTSKSAPAAAASTSKD